MIDEMSHPKVPATFDWVTARKNCNPTELFQKLRQKIERDIAVRNTQLDEQVYGFSFNSEKSNKFVAYVNGEGSGRPRASVAFRLKGSEIRAVDTTEAAETELFVGRPYLLSSGDCTLDIGGEPHALWQVSRRALEDLLFPTTD